MYAPFLKEDGGVFVRSALCFMCHSGSKNCDADSVTISRTVTAFLATVAVTVFFQQWQ
jgi:hypothetical protein